jgi:H+/Cl- antiporter ClcA
LGCWSYALTPGGGHGIPEAIEAVLTRQSRIAASTPVTKPVSAAVSIGTGRPFGAMGLSGLTPT